jgi:predicted HAD superfamily Cof-like phosphohydrolase
MSTLETQYRNYKECNPLSDFTFEQWQTWNANLLASAIAKYREDKPKILKDIENQNYVPFVSEVEIFNKTMGKPNNYTPNIPDEKEWKFVYDFILEELEEYKHACETGNIVEILDALCDITYVSLGNGAMLHGLKDKIIPAYQEVQASNMSKACKTLEEAEETVIVRSKQQGEPCHIEPQGEYWVVYRSRDRKVMKSINYFKPNLNQFF